MYDEVNSNQENGENPRETTPEPVDSEINGTSEQTYEDTTAQQAEYHSSEQTQGYQQEGQSYDHSAEEEEPRTRFYEESSDTEFSGRQETSDRAEHDQEQAAKQAPSFYHYSYDRSGQSGENVQQKMPGEEERQAESHRKPVNKIWSKLAVSAAVALVFGVVGGVAFQATNFVAGKAVTTETEAKIESAGVVGNQTSSQSDGQETVPVSSSAGADITQVAENTMPSIVAITTISVQEVQSMFFGTQEQTEEGSGSGIIVDQNDSELLIATNNHVVEGAQTLSVCFTVEVENQEDLVVEGQIKGTDPDNDLAIVAVKLADIPESVKSQIKVIELGDSDQLKVGQQVVAIGNALGYGQSVTVGYVSALDREVTVDDVTNNLIQTDAAINFGNSGGALLNTSGQLIGINSVKAAAEGVEGMGYAIPINTANPILSDLMNRTTRTKVDENKKGYMGVTLADVSDEAKEVYNMPSGAFVYSVEEGSAAEQAGFKKGDIITKFDGITISSRDDMLDRMNYYEAGETVDVVLSSANNGEYQERTVSITLGAANDAQSSSESESQSQQESGRQSQGQGGEGSVTPFQDLFPEESYGQ